MTFRVINGGGRPPQPTADSIEAARAVILDRVAAAIYRAHAHFPDPAYATWEELKHLAVNGEAQAKLVRSFQAQARFAVQALCPAWDPADADIEVAAEAWSASAIDGSPSACLIDVHGWISEVLK